MSPHAALLVLVVALAVIILAALAMAWRVMSAPRLRSLAEFEKRRARHREAVRLGREVKGAAVHGQRTGVEAGR